MLSASLWFGGLIAFAVGFKRALTSIEESTRSTFTMAVISRFSAVALPAVAVLVASGVYGSIAHFVTWKSLTENPYGRIILAKVLLLIPLLALGYYHFRFGRGTAVRLFAVTVSCEALIVIAILSLSAVLTGLPPPLPPGSDHG